MAKLTVNIGQSANDRQGDNLRTAFSKINGNFDFVLGGKPLGTVTVDGENEIRITTINDLINIYYDGIEYKIK